MAIPAAVPIIASAGAVASNILGSIFGSSSQDKANQANLQATRETNALNERLFYENLQNQNLWNERAYTEYWKQRKYDSIANQRAQYEQGGINPYFALGNMQTGQAAGSTPSPSGGTSTPSMATPTFGAYDPSQSFANVGNAISQGVNSYYENSLKKAESTQKELQNLNQVDRDLAEIEEKRSAAKKNNADTTLLDEQYNALHEQRTTILDNLKKSGKLLTEQARTTQHQGTLAREQAYLTNLQSEGTEISNDVYRYCKPWQIRSIQLSVEEALSRINLNSASAGNQLASALLSKSEEVGVRIDNFQKNRINHLIRNGVKLENDIKRMHLGKDGSIWSGQYNPLRMTFQSLLNGGAIAAGAYLGRR